MSRPRSRTPLHSRNSNQNGRRRDGFYGGLYQANPWRGQELVNEAESAENWENSYSRKEDQVDHWAKFIEAIGQAGKGKPSPMTRYLEEKSSRSPRRSHRERSSFSEAVNYEAETHDGNHSMGRRRNDHDVHSHRHYSRGASPRMEHGYQNEEHEPRHQHERGSYMASHLGYSSDRQLSLDLVNVGRQRLDFLPMLEHSGSYRETAMHTGTFAQEIISLVHHVKENYFQGQGVPLNERFSDQQLYTLVDEEQFANAEELEDTGPIINRPFFSRSSDTQVFCKVGPLQKRLQPPGPGDLRFDLEKKRLQKLEGVKITIAGNSRIPPQQPQENKPAYADVEYRPDSLSDLGWSKLEHQRTDQWDGPPAKRFAPNFNARRNSDRLGTRSGPRGRRNPNIGTRW
ncbi:bcl-2-associated transcription factor 1 isoform X2 [Trichomycterus rosablanca]|uniref:bcl-2-associated transcription factor 1 isoform X2 n=1 Tax=Trichomycterus rosablanca TaxID=2290929 RepID=UPI002F35ABB8